MPMKFCCVRTVPVRIRNENHQLLTSIQGLPAAGTLHRPVDTRLQPVSLPSGGLVLDDYLARRLGVNVGDSVWVDVLEGRQARLQLPVVQLVQQYADFLPTWSWMPSTVHWVMAT